MMTNQIAKVMNQMPYMMQLQRLQPEIRVSTRTSQNKILLRVVMRGIMIHTNRKYYKEKSKLAPRRIVWGQALRKKKERRYALLI